MRKLLLSIILMLPCFGFAQSVMGIDFGSSYETTKSLLEKRLGNFSVHKDEGGLSIFDFKMGELKFHIGNFTFQYDGDKSYLNGAYFQYYNESNDVEFMKERRDYLYSLIKDKYGEYVGEFISGQGFKCYTFGTNPKDESQILGFIILAREKGKDGKERLYLHLDYGPIYYIDKSSDF